MNEILGKKPKGDARINVDHTKAFIAAAADTSEKSEMSKCIKEELSNSSS